MLMNLSNVQAMDLMANALTRAIEAQHVCFDKIHSEELLDEEELFFADMRSELISCLTILEEFMMDKFDLSYSERAIERDSAVFPHVVS